MARNKVTKKELGKHLTVMLLSLSTWFFISPIYDLMATNFQLNPTVQMVIGGIGILFILYFWRF